MNLEQFPEIWKNKTTEELKAQRHKAAVIARHRDNQEELQASPCERGATGVTLRKRSYRRPACRIKQSPWQAGQVIGIATHSFGMLAMTNQDLFALENFRMPEEYPYFYATYERGFIKGLYSFYKIFITEHSLLGARIASNTERIFNLASGIIAAGAAFILPGHYKIFQNAGAPIIAVLVGFLIFYFLKYAFTPYFKSKQIKAENKYKDFNFDSDSFLRADKANFCIKLDDIEKGILAINYISNIAKLDLYMADKSQTQLNLIKNDNISIVRDDLYKSIRFLQIIA